MMVDPNVLLQIRDLNTWFSSGDKPTRAVDGVSLDIQRGETLALLGESGCGKSMTALSIMRLVPEPAGKIVSGQVYLDGIDLLKLPETQMRDIRGRRIAMIFQEPMTSLNPVLTVGWQIEETVIRHGNSRDKQNPRLRVLDLLDAVGIPDPPMRYSEYPHQLSGGLKQRIMIAIALAGEPDLLIADEPTTALDVTIQSQVLDLLRDLQKRKEMALLLITHDLGVVADMADRVAVMYAGQIVELADRERFFSNPSHPYSQKLFDSLPKMSKRDQRLAVIRGTVPALDTEFVGCRFEPRCDKALPNCGSEIPQWLDADNGDGIRCHLYGDGASHLGATGSNDSVVTGKVPASVSNSASNSVATSGSKEKNHHAKSEELLKVNTLKVHFPIQKGLLRRTVGFVRAVDGVSLTINRGSTLALVGESGCGKTTVGKSILQLIKPTDGRVVMLGTELTTLNNKQLRPHRGSMQIIFQDPYSSMNPRMMVADIIEEGMLAQNRGGDAEQRQSRIDELLEQVGLTTDAKRRYPHEFSGGQRQRICIARALAVEPQLIICDEPTSALDVSVQAQILNLLKDLQTNLGMAYLFITHDLSVVEYIADEIAVMYLGRIVERGNVHDIMENPKHPYTQALLSAVPSIEPNSNRAVIKLRGELPSPANPPSGCHFHPRCAKALPNCQDTYPASIALTETHQASCHLFTEN